MRFDLVAGLQHRMWYTHPVQWRTTAIKVILFTKYITMHMHDDIVHNTHALYIGGLLKVCACVRAY